jgi:hypothetical protein
MLQTSENKLLGSDEHRRDNLIDKLLQSPLAKELERSIRGDAVRARARQALEEAQAPADAARLEQLAQTAQTLTAECNRLRAELKAAERAADSAWTRLDDLRERIIAQRASASAIAAASGRWLEANNLHTAEDVERRLGIRSRTGA